MGMHSYSIELNPKHNDLCKRCSRADRARYQEGDLCQEATSVEDGLQVRCVGEWAYEKIYRLVQYFGIFVQGMKKKWSGRLNYIEICSGPGRCVLREDGEEVDGTALAIARHPSFPVLNQAVFVDCNQSTLEVLDSRLSNAGVNREKVRTVRGDFTNLEQLRLILNDIPKGHLNLVFIDPTECNLPFSTITLITSVLTSVDLIINVAVGTDANRNLVSAFVDPRFTKAREKYSAFLGSALFFNNPENRRAAELGNNRVLRERFVAEYTRRLNEIGFVYTDMKAVRTYYSLLFASRHPRGLDFWRKANKIEPDGQRTLGFDD